MTRKKLVIYLSLFIAFFSLAVPVFAFTQRFLDGTNKFYKNVCYPTNTSMSLNDKVLCYLIEKSREDDTRDATQSAQISQLEQRITALEILLTPSPTPSPSPTLLSEDFNGTSLDPNTWEVFPNNGSYSINNGFLTLPGGSNVPFIRSKNNPFPNSGTFTLEFGIQFLTQAGGGDGLAVSFTQQANVADANTWPNNPLALWQDPVGFRIVRHGSNALTISASDFNYHIVRFVYDGQKYTVIIDNNPIYTSPDTPTVGGLWFGHPSYCCPTGGQWTGFKLDYIRVTSP